MYYTEIHIVTLTKLQQFFPDFMEGVSDDECTSSDDYIDEAMVPGTSGIKSVPQTGKSSKNSSQQV